MKRKKLIVIGGPTASGKTGVSVALAKALNCEILSSDSRQFYKEISIGTAKPDAKEQEGIKHHFIDSHSILDPLNAGQYEKQALAVLSETFKTHNYAILVGGSGMFIDALIYGIDDLPSDPFIKAALNKELEENDLQCLQDKLKKLDPEFYAKMEMKNPHRIIRALEIVTITGKTHAELRTGAKKERTFDTELFILNHDRKELYDRINLRVDLMLKQGLIAEVNAIKEHRHIQSLNTVGYKEFFEHYDGLHSFETAVELVKRNSRRYAKRQITWFKRYKKAHWIDYTTKQQVVEQILKELNN